MGTFSPAIFGLVALIMVGVPLVILALLLRAVRRRAQRDAGMPN
jgi:hypothetical protein